VAKKIIWEPSRTLHEFRLLPGLTTPECVHEQISLKTPLVYTKEGERPFILNTPLISAAMQSVSGERMGIALAREGGLAFVYCSQAIESQAAMIKTIKNHKAGFVVPRTVHRGATIHELYQLSQEHQCSIFPVIDDNGLFLGLITKNDYDRKKHATMHVTERMIPREQLEVGIEVTDLKTANNLLVETHQSVLPIVDKNNRLLYLVFRKDLRGHLGRPNEVVDSKKRLLSAAAINTHDYKERVPALVEAGVDVLALDSSDGFSFYQKETLEWMTSNYPDIPVIGGNIITPEGFNYLVESGARGIKVGMGGGSICITQEQKGTGRGLATSVIEVVKARDAYFKKTGKYIPVWADGGIGTAKEITIALALGADGVMMGRYFARMDESPTEKVTLNNRVMKPYWGEGAARAREWKNNRYHQSKFVEGVEGFVEYAGKLKENLDETLAKIRSSMSSCGCGTIQEFHEKAELEIVSALSIREGMVHDVYLPNPENSAYNYN